MKKVSDTINNYFIKKSGLYHYLSTAKSNYREHLKGETVRLKKYFYVLRPLLACKWILAKQTPPPMLFTDLTKEFLEPEIHPYVDELLHIKMNTPEVGEGKRIDKLNEYLDNSISEIEEIIKNLPEENKGNWDNLNKIFLLLL